MNDNTPQPPNDSKHWKWGLFYYNPSDPRLFPPKRIPALGWTVNFANPRSILAMLALFAVILVVWVVMKK